MTDTELWFRAFYRDFHHSMPLSCVISDNGEVQLIASYRIFELMKAVPADCPALIRAYGSTQLDIVAASPAGQELIARSVVWKWASPFCPRCGANKVRGNYIGLDDWDLNPRVKVTECESCGSEINVPLFRKATLEDARYEDARYRLELDMDVESSIQISGQPLQKLPFITPPKLRPKVTPL
jgi:hypothetical protein